MKMNKEIKSITVLSGNGDKVFKVGDIHNKNVISKIEDRNMEFDNSIEFIYACLDENGEHLFTIENCSVIAEFGDKNSQQES